MDISTIIVNYKTADLVSQYIKCLLMQEGVTHEIIVVDNDSQDNSLEELAKFGDKVQVIVNKDNVGFGRAVNQAAKVAKGAFLFFLNPDAYLQDTLAFKKMLDYMNENQCLLAATLLKDEAGNDLENVLNDYPEQALVKNPPKGFPGNVAWVWGTSMILSRLVWEQLGGFDPQFFLNYEDCDYGLQVRKLGHKIGVINSVTAIHIGCVSRERSETFNKRIDPVQDLLRFCVKHYGNESTLKIIDHYKKKWQRQINIYRLLKNIFRSKDAAYRMEKYGLIYQAYQGFYLENFKNVKTHEGA